MQNLAYPYDRSFKIGRGSELLANEELHKVYEATKHLNDTPEEGDTPDAKLHGSVWHDKNTNELKWFDKSTGRWRRYYENEFKRTDEIMNVLPPADAIPGQLWLNHGILCYFDGAAWNPVKADAQDGSQFNLDLFHNFMLMSPLQTVGSAVTEDLDVADYKKRLRQYQQGVLDVETDSQFTGDGTKWKPDMPENTDRDIHPAMPALEGDKKYQMLIPHADTARIFLDHKLDNSYERINDCCIQYDRKLVLDHTPSLVHVNPGRLSNITKRLVLVDRANPKIMIPPSNTEYYGFRFGERLGDFLCPDTENENGDYTIQGDGILLSYNAAQSYDCVLAVTFEFMWMKSTGRTTSFDYSDEKTHYYVENYQGPNSVFLEGLNLEDTCFSEDSTMQMIGLSQPAEGLSLSMIHVPKREYGYVRQTDAQNRAIIRPVQQFDAGDSIVFVNGQALSNTYDGVVFDGGTIYVPGAREGMMWSVMSLTEGDYTARKLTGLVEKDGTIDCSSIQVWETDEEGNIAYQKDGGGNYIYERDEKGRIQYERDETGNFVLVRDEEGHVVYDHGADGEILHDSTGRPVAMKEPKKIRTLRVILFIDGLLVRNEDIHIDYASRKLTVDGLREEQEYILIEDRKHWLYSDGKLCPAIPTGAISESLVYYNNQLINNGVCVDTEKDITAVEGCYNEVKCFINRERITKPRLDKDGNPLKGINGDPIYEVQTRVVSREYRYYDSRDKHWKPVHENIAPQLEITTHSYENTLGGIRLNMGYSDEDNVRIYGFHYANDITNPVRVFSELVEGATAIKTKTSFLPGRNTLKVWINGIRQYPKITEDDNGIVESPYGDSFELPKLLESGLVTYAIEMPADGEDAPCDVERLDEKNILPGYVNMYHTDIDLYPGRATVYVNGLRLPKEGFTLLDNHTLIINGDTQLIGSTNNFPLEPVTYGDNQHKNIEHVEADQILVEVRRDDRREQTILMADHTKPEIDLGLYEVSPALLEPADEIMIFINGLYFGPKMNEGYQLLPSRNSLLIQNEYMKDIMAPDIRQAVAKTEIELRDYFMRRGRKAVPQPDTVFTFVWR